MSGTGCKQNEMAEFQIAVPLLLHSCAVSCYLILRRICLEDL